MEEEDPTHKIVREAYARRVTDKPSGCCCSKKKSCCSKILPSEDTKRAAEKMGYSQEDIDSVPEGSNLGLGCGAPLGAADLKPGNVVLDLGSGAGFDAFLSARRVGPTGKVIGVDMTPEMVEKAKSNASKNNYTNVDFRLGKIENLPVESDSVDVIISNCVVNLSPDKRSVFREAYRVLKPGGRVALSDICLQRPLPDAARKSISAYVGCIAGASMLEDYKQILRDCGFVNVEATTKVAFDILACDDPSMKDILDEVRDETDVNSMKDAIVSATVVAYKKQ